MLRTTGDGTPVEDYIWVDSELAQFTELGAGVKTYVMNDHLFTPRLGTDETQTVAWSWVVDAFNRSLPNTDPDADGTSVDLKIGFPGQYRDDESGFYYNWNRYYDPTLGRYVTSDPIGLNGGLNSYLYANANPIIFIDQYGLYCLSPEQIAAIAGGIGGGIGGAVTGGITGAAAGLASAIAGSIGFGFSGAGLGFGAGAASGAIGDTAAGAISGAISGIPGMAVGAAGGVLSARLGGGVFGGVVGGALGGIGGIPSAIGGSVGGAIGGITERILTRNNDCGDECEE